MADREGVVFARKDCAGLIRRMLILIVDGAVTASAGIAVAAAHELLPDLLDGYGEALAWGWACFGFAYLVLLESRSATLGFLLFNFAFFEVERPASSAL
jgi:hypothetical protein